MLTPAPASSMTLGGLLLHCGRVRVSGGILLRLTSRTELLGGNLLGFAGLLISALTGAGTDYLPFLAQLLQAEALRCGQLQEPLHRLTAMDRRHPKWPAPCLGCCAATHAGSGETRHLRRSISVI